MHYWSIGCGSRDLCLSIMHCNHLSSMVFSNIWNSVHFDITRHTQYNMKCAHSLECSTNQFTMEMNAANLSKSSFSTILLDKHIFATITRALFYSFNVVNLIQRHTFLWYPFCVKLVDIVHINRNSDLFFSIIIVSAIHFVHMQNTRTKKMSLAVDILLKCPRFYVIRRCHLNAVNSITPYQNAVLIFISLLFSVDFCRSVCCFTGDVIILALLWIGYTLWTRRHHTGDKIQLNAFMFSKMCVF